MWKFAYENLPNNRFLLTRIGQVSTTVSQCTLPETNSELAPENFNNSKGTGTWKFIEKFPFGANCAYFKGLWLLVSGSAIGT